MTPAATHAHESAGLVVPDQLTGRRDPSVSFGAVAIGLSETGLGFRSSDQKLGVSSVETLLRQPFVLVFHAPGLKTQEIIVRILRVEACRHDPAYLYFGAAEFLSISDVDVLTLQTGLKIFESRKKPPPVFSAPPPPPSR